LSLDLSILPAAIKRKAWLAPQIIMSVLLISILPSLINVLNSNQSDTKLYAFVIILILITGINAVPVVFYFIKLAQARENVKEANRVLEKAILYCDLVKTCVPESKQIDLDNIKLFFDKLCRIP
jgi:uncharacterized membrane protein